MLGLAGEIDGFDGVDAGFDGEVEGSSSKHGKISLNYINRSISSVFKKKNESILYL